jgi:hypothetical protein
MNAIGHRRRLFPASLPPVKRVIAIGFAIVVTALASAAGAGAQATAVTSNEQIPVAVFVFIPCANAGAGEFAVLDGTLHVLSHVTFDAQGGVHVTQHFQPQGVRGVGFTTGDRYQGTGVTRSQFNASAGSKSTYINNFRIIGQGPSNNYLVHAVFHVTITPNGDVSTVVDNFSVECR